MAKKSVVYMGPSRSFDGKPVPREGLKVSLDEAVIRDMSRRGHQFDDEAVTAAAQGVQAADEKK